MTDSKKLYIVQRRGKFSLQTDGSADRALARIGPKRTTFSEVAKMLETTTTDELASHFGEDCPYEEMLMEFMGVCYKIGHAVKDLPNQVDSYQFADQCICNFTGGHNPTVTFSRVPQYAERAKNIAEFPKLQECIAENPSFFIVSSVRILALSFAQHAYKKAFL